MLITEPGVTGKQRLTQWPVPVAVRRQQRPWI